MMRKYRKKPVEIVALQWKGDNHAEMYKFLGLENITEGPVATPTFFWNESNGLWIHTLEGQMKASKHDYIIKGVKGEFYPCKPDIFEMTYEEVTN